jgi:hypothetical protein
MPTLDDLPTIPKLVALSANDLIPVSDSSASSSGASKVKHIPAALAAQGFTHAWVINFNNAELDATTTNDLDDTINLLAIPANSVITKARLVVTRAFTGLTAVNAFVGRTADTDGYITSSSLLAKNVFENTGAEIDLVNEIDVVTASDQTLSITFDPANNTQALGSLTAGQVVLLISMTSIDDYANLVPAT